MILWKIHLDQSSIFSGPSTNESDIFVTTLAGSLYSIDVSGPVNWLLELDKPVFASPVLNTSKSLLFVGTVSGCLFCIQFDGIIVNILLYFYSSLFELKILFFEFKKWKFQTQGPIFNSACLYKTKVFFGSHDHYLYCLEEETGYLCWKFNMEGEIYSSPTIINNCINTIVVCLSSDGIFCIIDLGGKCLLKKDLFNLRKSCFSSPIFFNDRIYVGCRDNFVYSFKLEIE